MKNNELNVYKELQSILLEKDIKLKDDKIASLMLDIKKVRKFINPKIKTDGVEIGINKENGLSLSLTGSHSIEELIDILTLLAKASGRIMTIPYEEIKKNILVKQNIDTDELLKELEEGFVSEYMKILKKTFNEYISKGSK